MARTVSTTTLSFGLISTEVKLKVVQEKKDTSFNLASPAGNPVKQMYVDEATGEMVGPSSECVRGIFTDDGFREVSAETIKIIDEESKLDALNIDGFVSLDEAPFERATKAYYVAPGGKGGKAAVKPLALLRDGLKARKVAAYGKVTITKKTYPFLLAEREDGLILTICVYADEFAQMADAATVLEGVEPSDAKTLALFATLADQIGGSRVEFDALADDRREKREELVAQVLAGKTIAASEKPQAAAVEVTDLADLLTASIAAAATKVAA